MLAPTSLFDGVEFWPRWNQKAEERLEADLGTLSSASPKDAAERIEVLAAEHQHRAAWVWALLDEAPLARAIACLREVAEIAQASGSPSTWEGLADYYRSTGWKADYAVLRALDAARSTAAQRAVSTAIRAVYLPWLEKFSMLMQSLAATYPATGPRGCRVLPVEEGTVYLFADGLRLDLARALEARLARADLDAELSSDWSALPTVTATAKPAFLPLAERLGGPLTGAGFQAKERASGKDLVQARFKQILTELGMSDLEPTELGLPIGCAWTEYGCVDTYGHEQGAKLSWRVEEELDGLQRRVTELLRAGWRKVRVITGPRLAPASRRAAQGRAAPAPDRVPLEPMRGPWAGRAAWLSHDLLVLGRSRGGRPGARRVVLSRREEYAHGGLTMQEALIPSLTVTARKAGGTRVVVLKSLKWAGMRLNAVFEGAAGLVVDLRGKAADAGTSFAANPVVASADGQKTSLLVPDDDRVGTAACPGRDRSAPARVSSSIPSSSGRTGMQLDALDEIAARAYEGFLVRKDLSASSRGSTRCRPTSSSSCSALLRQRRRGRDRRGARDRGAAALEPHGAHRRGGAVQGPRQGARAASKLIDIVKARLDAKNDCYLAELPSLRLSDVRIDDELVHDNERMLTDGFYAEVTLTYDAASRRRRTGGRSASTRCARSRCRSPTCWMSLCQGEARLHDDGVEGLLLIRSVGLEPLLCSSERTRDRHAAAHGAVRRAQLQPGRTRPARDRQEPPLPADLAVRAPDLRRQGDGREDVRQQRQRAARPGLPVRRRLLRRGVRHLLRPEGRRQHHEGLHGVRASSAAARRTSAPTAAS